MLFWWTISDSFLQIQIFSNIHSEFVSDESDRSVSVVLETLNVLVALTDMKYFSF